MIIDPRSAEGIALLDWMQVMMEKKLQSLVRPHKDHGETQYLRGQIKGLRMVAGYIRGDKEPDDTAG